jgi:mannitol 2-dehydrogenase
VIVHLGLGAFHRSHQAMYVARLDDSAWRICGVGVTESDRRVCEALTAQSGRYTLVLKHPDGTVEHEVIDSIVEVLLAPSDREAVVERMADPATRIVSLTITEGGYSSDEHGVFAMVAEALRRRRAAGLVPFTVMSCDNIEGNGEVARRAVCAAAGDLASWVAEEVCFPSSMVDRITPATTDEDRALVRRLWGISDDAPVMAEPFAQWVLEDRFGAGRPALESVGVHLVEDVRPYELMKLRLLNAGHQALAYPGLLLGHSWVHDAAADPALSGLLRAYWREALPTLPEVPGIDLDSYQETLLERFGNPHVADTLARLASFASDRIPAFLLPVVRHRIAAGGSVEAAALVVAAWIRCRELGEWQLVEQRDLPSGPELLAHRALGEVPSPFRDAVLRALEAVRRDPRAALLAI